MPEATSEAEPGVRPGPRWARADLAWPLAVLAGFLGTWIGLVVGLPFAATPFAFALFLPLAWTVRQQGEHTLVTWLGVAFLAGTAGAVAGTAMEDGSAERVLGLPLAGPVTGGEFAVLEAEGSAPDPWGTLPRNLGFLALIVLAGRFTGGLGAVFVAGSGAAAVSAGAAAQLSPAVSDPLRTFLASWPPHLALALVGGVLVSGALAAPRRGGPGGGGEGANPEPRWDLLGPGLALAATGLLAQGLWIPLWVSWAR